MVDTGATTLSLPKRLISELGLRQLRTARARTSGGMTTFGIYSPVRLTIQSRDCVVEVAELPDDCPPLIGVIPLEILDFVVDPKRLLLIGNPDHGGESNRWTCFDQEPCVSQESPTSDIFAGG